MVDSNSYPENIDVNKSSVVVHRAVDRASSSSLNWPSQHGRSFSRAKRMEFSLHVEGRGKTAEAEAEAEEDKVEGGG